MRLVAIALVERFADADDRHEAGGERRVRLLVDGVVGLAEQRAALGVADDHVARAGLAHHRRADLAGERALALPVHVLRGRRRSRCLARGFSRGRERRERRRDRDVDAAHVLDQRAQIVDVRRRSRRPS